MEKQEIVDRLIGILEERAKAEGIMFNASRPLGIWAIKRFLLALDIECLQSIYQDGNPLIGIGRGDYVTNINLYTKLNKSGSRLMFIIMDFGIIIQMVEKFLVISDFGCRTGTSVKEMDFDEFVFENRTGIRNFLSN